MAQSPFVLWTFLKKYLLIIYVTYPLVQSDPEKARRRAQIREQKEAAARRGNQAGESTIDLDKIKAAAESPTEAQIRQINQKWEDNEITSRLYDLIKHRQVDDLSEIFNQMPLYAHVRSKDGRGPMW